MMDSENKDALLKLMRYNASNTETMIGLDDYVKSMKAGQNKIYYVTGATREVAMNNPFMEVFKDSDLPILILTNNIDEVLFNQITDYKNFKFQSIESSYEEISKDLGDKAHTQSDAPSLPDEDVTSFSLWLKNELSSNISKVTISKRLKGVPAVLFGQISSSMRMVMTMMEQQG